MSNHALFQMHGTLRENRRVTGKCVIEQIRMAHEVNCFMETKLCRRVLENIFVQFEFSVHHCLLFVCPEFQAEHHRQLQAHHDQIRRQREEQLRLMQQQLEVCHFFTQLLIFQMSCQTTVTLQLACLQYCINDKAFIYQR